MKLTNINLSTVCLIPMICLLLSNVVAEDAMQSMPPMSQVEEISERMDLYKRIKHEQNKKALMQLLHDIADLQKQCRDKGFLCSIDGSDTLPPLIDFNHHTPQSDDTDSVGQKTDTVVAKIALLGIVGNRARFRLEDGSIRDFSLGEQIADLWEITEIGSDAALLVHKVQPEIKFRYQIRHTANLGSMPSEENTVVHIP